MFQLRIDTVTVVKEMAQIFVVNKCSKAPDSGEARESCCRQSSFLQPHVLKGSLGRKSEYCPYAKLRRSIKYLISVQYLPCTNEQLYYEFVSLSFDTC